MDTLKVDLTSILVDNPSIYSTCTKVDLILEFAEQALSVENLEGGPRSLHRFRVSDASDLGCGGEHALTAHQSSLVLAMACSLANTRLLFSPLQPRQLLTSLGTSKVAEMVGVVIDIGVTLDANEILSLVDKLLKLRIFNRGNRAVLEQNVVEAIWAYWEAMKSIDGLTCYSHLYDAFNKAVNADRGHRGKTFETVASNMTGLSVSDIKKLKEFDDRVRHVLRSKGDFKSLEAGETRLGQKALVLKKAADSAILSRT
jgi:hypothetical protein